MEIDRADGRTPNQMRPLACSRGVLNRAHGSASWSQGDTKVLAAVYGPKAGTRKNENPEKACFDVVWKPKTGQMGKPEKEYEMVLKKTLQSICLLTVNPNTTTSIIIQVVNDDGALLPCAINAACAALVDAGIPLKHLAVAICCSVTESGYVILDPSKLEEQKMKAFVYLVFPNSTVSVLPQDSLQAGGEPMEHGIITSVTHGVMPETCVDAHAISRGSLQHICRSRGLVPLGMAYSLHILEQLCNSILFFQIMDTPSHVDDYFHCLERGCAASSKLSDFLRKTLQLNLPTDSSKAG